MSATNPTFGELRFRLQKEHPGVDADILDGWMNERYRDILRALPWRRLAVTATLTVPADYEEETLAVTAGSTALTGTDTTWTSAMSGRRIRIGGRNEYYTFTYVGATSGTLDRGFEGDTVTAASYKIWKAIYALPAACHLLRNVRPLLRPRDLDQVTPETLDQMAPHRPGYGTPALWAPYDDDTSTPPLHQIELYPAPITAQGIPIRYTQDPTLFAATGTASFFAAWLQPNALLEGVRAMALRAEKDYMGAGIAREEARVALNLMVRAEAHRRGSTKLRMAGVHTRHRILRWAGRGGGNWNWGPMEEVE